MIVVDTSAWIEYFKDGEPSVVNKVDRCLDQDRDFDVMARHIGLRIS